MGTCGPCITSLYQIAPAEAATKLRLSSGRLAEPVMRAIRKRGSPLKMVDENGAVYRARSMHVGCARVGI